MNLLKTPLRRTTAIVAGALIGAAGAAAFAAPASAHHPELVGKTTCADKDGNWTVNWTVTNSESDITAKIVEVTRVFPLPLPNRPDAPPTGINEGDTLPKAGEGSLGAIQQLLKEHKKAQISVKARWIRNGDQVTETAFSPVIEQPAPCPTPPTPTPPSPTPPSPTPTTTVPPVENTPVPSPTPGDPGGGGGDLPLTGSAATNIAAGAGVLLAVGAALFFMARRRRVTFTA